MLLLSGCSKDNEAERNTIQNNERVNFITVSLNEAKQTSQFLEPIVKDSLITGNNQELLSPTVATYGDDLSQKLLYAVAPIRNKMNDYIAVQKLRKDSATDSPLASASVEVPTISELVDNSMEVHYMLDDQTGKLDQFFLFRMPDGTNIGMSVYWIRGAYVGFKTMGLD